MTVGQSVSSAMEKSSPVSDAGHGHDYDFIIDWRFFNGYIAYMALVGVVACTIIFLVPHTDQTNPRIRFRGLAVSNFSITTGATVAATWELNVTVINPNTNGPAILEDMEIIVYYDHSDEWLALSSINIEPAVLVVDDNSNASITTRSTTTTSFSGLVVEDMRRDLLDMGILRVGFSIHMKEVVFPHRHHHHEESVATYYCPSLTLPIQSSGGDHIDLVSFSTDDPIECSSLMPEDYLSILPVPIGNQVSGLSWT